MNHPDPIHIGRYEIVTLLGEGRITRDYLAVNRGRIGFNKLVVVKHVRPELAWDREFLTMFADDARIAARLNHPNVAQTYEVTEDGGQYLLAMEYLEGQTLADLLRRMGRANMPLEEHLWMLTRVLVGLHYAHELCDYDGTPLGVVHRDLSPSNVFITYHGDVKLLDFGIAKAAGDISGIRKGTANERIGYSAPEHFFGEDVDRRADIYSVGVMLWEALARKRRKLGDTPAASLRALMAGQASKIRDVDPEIPSRLAEICDRAIALDPLDRYGSAAEFLTNLEGYLEKYMRPVDRREVEALMGTYFSADRLEMTKRLEGKIGTLRAASTSEPPVSSVSSSRAPTVIDISGQKEESSESIPDFRPWWSHGKPRLMAASAVLVLAIVAVVSRVERPSPGATGAAMPSAAPDVVEASPSAAASSDNQPSAESETVRFSVKVEPVSATLVFDGKKLPTNPFQTDPLRDSRSHVLRMSAPGFFPVERTVNFLHDVNLVISLRPTPTPRTLKQADDSDIPSGARTEPKEVEPGADLQHQEAPRTGRHIDETDPYGR